MSKLTKAVLVDAAKELNTVLGLDPAIDLKAKRDALEKALCEAAELIDGDELTDPTWEVLYTIEALPRPSEESGEDEPEDEDADEDTGEGDEAEEADDDPADEADEDAPAPKKDKPKKDKPKKDKPKKEKTDMTERLRGPEGTSFKKMAAELLAAGKTDEQIIAAMVPIYVAKGQDEAYGTKRAKTYIWLAKKEAK